MMNLNNAVESSSPRVGILIPPESSSSRVEIMLASPEWHVVCTFLITTLVGLLQLMSQNKDNDESPFATHPTNFKAFFLTFRVYSFIPLAKAVFPTHCRRYSLILSHLRIISGLLSSSSLLTNFFPRWLTKLLISTVGVSIPLILGRHWIKDVIHERLREKVITAVTYVIDAFRRLMRRNLMNQRPFVV